PGGRADRHFVGQQLTIAARARAGRGVGDGGAVRLALLIGAAGLLGGAGPGNQRTRQQQGQNKQKGTPHNCSSSWTGGLGHDLLSTTSWSQPLGRDASARWQATPADESTNRVGLACRDRPRQLQKYAMRRPHAAVANQILNDSMAQARTGVGNGVKAGVRSTAAAIRRPASTAFRIPSPIKLALIWNTGLLATWVASALNRAAPVSAISSKPRAAQRRAGRTTPPGGVPAKAPSRRASMIATALMNSISARMCPTLAVM